jgi:DNA-binding NtrC family response regulator
MTPPSGSTSQSASGSAAAARKARVLVADDERAITDGLSAILADEGYDVAVASDGESAMSLLSNESFGLVLADLNMPELDGMSLLKNLQDRKIATECIIITGRATVDSAVQAMQMGAYDYIEKPLNAEKLNRLKALISKALHKYAVQQSNRELSQKLEGLTHYGEIVGQSEPMRQVYSVIDVVAPSTASVLIFGESGTGKELVARALHTRSERSSGPFLPLNCAALPKDILENELFGHEKGAFTGSTNEKPGAFEMAHGGTLFLDEVAEMAPEIQVKLLRALESRSIRRLGGKKEISVDIRVVAATNKDVQQAIADGKLRDDLYYRLAVVEVALPPLRERVGDIKLLATEFLSRFATANQKRLNSFESAAWDWILSYPWPGNVRELKNAVERAVIMARGDTVSRDDIVPLHLRGEAPSTFNIEVGTPLAIARRSLVLRTLATVAGDKTRAGKMLGMSVTEIERELESLLNGDGGHTSGESDTPVRTAEKLHRNGGESAPARSAPRKEVKRK